MKKWIIGILVVALIAVMIVLNLNKNNDSTASSQVISRNAVAVKATRIETGSISSYVTAPGLVKEVNKA